MIRSLPDPSMVCTTSMLCRSSNGVMQTREVLVVSESGLDYLTMNSTKPDARLFQAEVLRIIYTIRHTGTYIPQTTLHQLQAGNGIILNQYLKEVEEHYKTELADPNSPHNTLQANLMREKLFHTVDKNLDAYQRQHNAEKVNLANALISNLPHTISLGKLAKIIYNTDTNIGRNRLMELMRQDGFLMKTGPINIPTQKSVALGVLILAESNMLTTRVTPHGQQFFVTMYMNDPRL